MRMVVPAPRMLLMMPHSVRRIWGSRPAVGSSRKRIFGECMRARASTTRRFWPPESCFTGVSARSVILVRARSLSSASVRAFFGMRKKRPCMSRFSRMVRSGSRLRYWPATPHRALAATGSRAMSIPERSTRPLSGAVRPVRIRMVVVLPAPLGPRQATSSPRSA